MLEWIKRLLFLLAVLLVALLALLGVALHYLNGQPSYYRTYSWTPEQRAILNQQAADKFTAIHNLAAAAWASEVRAENSRTKSTRPASAAMAITLNQEQLNAFLVHNFKAEMDVFVTNSGVFLKDGRIILTGQPREFDLGYLLSAHFVPRITGDGRFQLDLDKVLAGRLSLPQPLIDMQMNRARALVQRRMPGWQRSATMDAQGACNTAFVEATLAQTLVASFDHKSGPPVLFMPGEKGKALPLRLTAIQIDDGQITFTVRPMDKSERDELRRGLIPDRPIR
ncbi:MAG: hypothetical protein ABSH20_08335 [Tepidisphaeraceae bacterium]|jgi:hypothetical protein